MKTVKSGNYIVVENKNQLKEVLTFLDSEGQDIRWLYTGYRPLEYIPEDIPFPYIVIVDSRRTITISAIETDSLLLEGLVELRWSRETTLLRQLYRQLNISLVALVQILLIAISLHFITEHSFAKPILFLALSLVVVAWVTKYTVDKERREID